MLVLMICLGLLSMVLCGVVANKRRRNLFGWLVLGFFFGIFALIVLLVLDPLGVPCENCRKMVDPLAKICLHCGSKREPTPIKKPVEDAW